MKLFKITFETKEENEWIKGWYYVEDSVVELQQWVKELYEEHEVRDLEIIMTDVKGWTKVAVEKKV